jgi:hypothetical protein
LTRKDLWKMKNFDPTDFFIQKDEDLLFNATLIEGPDINLFKVANLEETQELSEAVWNATNWQKLLEGCAFVSLIEEKEIDCSAPMTDVYYTYRVEDPVEFSNELRTIMLGLLAKLRSKSHRKI